MSCCEQTSASSGQVREVHCNDGGARATGRQAIRIGATDVVVEGK